MADIPTPTAIAQRLGIGLIEPFEIDLSAVHNIMNIMIKDMSI
jgi:hypothetical protein